jgi:hypothetical protein
MKPMPRAEIMVATPQPIIVPETIRMRVSSGRLSSRPTISGPPTIAVNITSTCWMPKSEVLTAPG